MADDRLLERLSREDLGPADPPESSLELGAAWALLEKAVDRVNLRDSRIVSRYWVLGGVVRNSTARDKAGWEASAFYVDAATGGIIGGVKAGNSTPALALEELAAVLDEKSAGVVLQGALAETKAARDPRLGS